MTASASFQMPRIVPRLQALGREEQGSSGVEFALLAPILCLILAVMIDFGLTLFTKLDIDEAVSASISYAVVSASNVTAANGAALATKLTAIIPTAIDTVVEVNAGPKATRTGGATPVASGTASMADKCYCPSVAAMAVTWGSAVTCNTACATGGGFAGKFVWIKATRLYSPLFSSYGISEAHNITAYSLVQVQ